MVVKKKVGVKKTGKTKYSMILELKKEFLKKQGSVKAKWVSNKLNKMKKTDVAEQYRRLKGNISFKNKK